MIRILLGVIVLGIALWFFWPSAAPVAESSAKPLSVPSPEKAPVTFETALPKARAPERALVENPLPLAVEPPRPAAIELGDWRTLPLSTSFSPSRAWSNWLCADLEGTPARSVWRLEDGTDDRSEIHPGSCEEWEKKNAIANPIEPTYTDEPLLWN